MRLMEAGWTSFALERYASYRYGETIAAGSFRSYKARKKIETKPSILLGSKPVPAGESNVDVMGAREELVLLQMKRIAIDASHEEGMTKLFGTTGKEIDLLSRLLDKVKEDQRDYGILPQVPTAVEISGSLQQQAVVREEEQAVPKHRTLGAVLGNGDEARARAIVEALATGKVVPIGLPKSG